MDCFNTIDQLVVNYHLGKLSSLAFKIVSYIQDHQFTHSLPLVINNAYLGPCGVQGTVLATRHTTVNKPGPLKAYALSGKRDRQAS